MSLMDKFAIISLAFISVVVIIIGFMIVNNIMSTGVFDDVPEAADTVTKTRQTILNFDNLMLAIIVFAGLASIVLASQVASHPVMFFISLIFLVIGIIVAAGVSNAFESFSTSDNISDAAEFFPKTTFLMAYLPFFILMEGVGIAIALYIGVKIIG